MNTITATADGSNTLFNAEIGENYHSKHGAVQESMHVFVEAGFQHVAKNLTSVRILEIGFGTGLNCLLTAASNKLYRNIEYTALETHPPDAAQIVQLGYNQFVSSEIWNAFISRYLLAQEATQLISEQLHLRIVVESLQQFSTDMRFDLIYFDAFSVRHQPEMWTQEMISKVVSFLEPGGYFVTYAITGDLKRALQNAGCSFEKLPGAPGKREMLRATKL